MSHQHLKNWSRVDRDAAIRSAGDLRLEMLLGLKKIRRAAQNHRPAVQLEKHSGICTHLSDLLLYDFNLYGLGTKLLEDCVVLDDPADNPLREYEKGRLWEGDQLAARLELLDALIGALEVQA